MNAKLKKEVLVNAGWFSGLALALAALIGISLARINTNRARLTEQRRTVEGKEASLRQWPEHAAGQEDPAAVERTLTGWRDMVASEARRVAELSAAARRAGVTLVAIKCFAQEFSADGLVVSVSHELGAVGSYRQLGRFLDGLYAREGLIGIERLELERAPGAPGDELKATLRVTWYAAGPGPQPEPASGEES